MKGGKCKNCGGGEIDTDPARGDAVCTTCGSVVESSIIVSTVQFEERATGAVSVLGQFVSSESKGAPRGLGPNFQSGVHTESRELTLSKAKKRITQLGQMLRVNQTCIDIAVNFFKMALNRQLTRGRRTEVVIAACLYMSCRMEGSAHMLIDFCDALDIDGVYTLGRTFQRLATTLCIKVPTPDPCLFVMRFASALNFGTMTHTVAMTAMRLVTRMKRDFIHTGRRASGLCGAALLIAARLHEFNRTVTDIVNIVKVHETTLKKRLLEFGETPSSLLSLDEFMTVDLEDEQDPPSFRAARKKDRSTGKIPNSEELDQRFAELQAEIERELAKNKSKKLKFDTSYDGVKGFNLEATVNAINSVIDDDVDATTSKMVDDGAIPPTYDSLMLGRDSSVAKHDAALSEEDELLGLDEEDLDKYIMKPSEVAMKSETWTINNADFLEKEKEREELKKAKEAMKPEKKRKRPSKKNRGQPAGSAFEAIEKMLQEKKLSNKINYEVLKNLTLPAMKVDTEPEVVPSTSSTYEPSEPEFKKPKIKEDVKVEPDAEEEEDDIEEVQPENDELSMADLLNRHRYDDDDGDMSYDDDDGY